MKSLGSLTFADDKLRGDKIIDKGHLRRSSNVMITIDNVKRTVFALERNFRVLGNLDAQQEMKFWDMKMKNNKLTNDLKEAEERNLNMLNLFRPCVADLPQSLKIQVKRSWQQKYDALLELNDRLKRELHQKSTALTQKDQQISDLQQNLLNAGERLIERDISLKNICNKYLSLKKRRDEQEVLLRGSIENLKDALLKRDTNVITKTRMSLMPTKDALLAYETRRSDRLAQENRLLRALLKKCARSPEAGSCVSFISN